jgi:hypothetical protein
VWKYGTAPRSPAVAGQIPNKLCVSRQISIAITITITSITNIVKWKRT